MVFTMRSRSIALSATAVTLAAIPAGLLATRAATTLAPRPAPAHAVLAHDGAVTASQQRATVRYWTRARMKAAIPVGSAARTSAAATARSAWLDGDSAGQGLRWVHDGAAEQTTGKVFFTLNGTDYVCSGTAISSPRSDVVLTAAHCVGDSDGDWAANWTFVPDYQGGTEPYGSFTARRFFVSPQWAGAGEDTPRAEEYDVAFVTVNATTASGAAAGTPTPRLPPNGSTPRLQAGTSAPRLATAEPLPTLTATPGPPTASGRPPAASGRSAASPGPSVTARTPAASASARTTAPSASAESPSAGATAPSPPVSLPVSPSSLPVSPSPSASASPSSSPSSLAGTDAASPPAEAPTRLLPAGQPVAFTSAQGSGTRTYVFGYPAESPFSGQYSNYCAGPTVAAQLSSTVALRCDMTAGDSGGPWLTGFDPRTGAGTVVAVTTFKYSGDTAVLYGTALGPADRELYAEASAATGS